LNGNVSNSAYAFEEPVFIEEFQPKDEETAVLLSILTPAVSIGLGSLLIRNNKNFFGGMLIAGGIILAPSAGNFYAQNVESVMKGIETRFSGSLITLGGTYLLVADGLNRSFGGDGNDTIAGGGFLLFLSGTGLIIYSTFYDIFNSKRCVRTYNETKGEVYYLCHFTCLLP
jgi:hypothetical protein